jgi:DNA-binding NarL/FixJ family response regulator
LREWHARGKRQRVAEKEKQGADNVRIDPLALEVGRIAKLFALYMLREVDDESKKVSRLNAVGFSAPEIALMLDKTESNVRVQISQAKAKKK